MRCGMTKWLYLDLKFLLVPPPPSPFLAQNIHFIGLRLVSKRANYRFYVSFMRKIFIPIDLGPETEKAPEMVSGAFSYLV
jgi:hypothetical protein